MWADDSHLLVRDGQQKAGHAADQGRQGPGLAARCCCCCCLDCLIQSELRCLWGSALECSFEGNHLKPVSLLFRHVGWAVYFGVKEVGSELTLPGSCLAWWPRALFAAASQGRMLAAGRDCRCISATAHITYGGWSAGTGLLLGCELRQTSAFERLQLCGTPSSSYACTKNTKGVNWTMLLLGTAI